MDAPAMVAVPLPMCRARSGSFASQGTSLRRLTISWSAVAFRAVFAGFGDIFAGADAGQAVTRGYRNGGLGIYVPQ